MTEEEYKRMMIEVHHREFCSRLQAYERQQIENAEYLRQRRLRVVHCISFIFSIFKGKRGVFSVRYEGGRQRTEHSKGKNSNSKQRRQT